MSVFELIFSSTHLCEFQIYSNSALVLIILNSDFYLKCLKMPSHLNFKIRKYYISILIYYPENYFISNIKFIWWLAVFEWNQKLCYISLVKMVWWLTLVSLMHFYHRHTMDIIQFTLVNCYNANKQSFGTHFSRIYIFTTMNFFFCWISKTLLVFSRAQQRMILLTIGI